MNCPECKAILTGDTLKRCRECINRRNYSIKEVEREYKGWLICEIIAARSHDTSVPMVREPEVTDGLS